MSPSLDSCLNDIYEPGNIPADPGQTPAVPPIVPTSTDPFFDNVVLLVSGDGSNGSTTIVDESSWEQGNATVVGNAQLTTTTPLTGTGSVLLDGTGDEFYWVVTGANKLQLNYSTADLTGTPSDAAVWTVDLQWRPGTAGEVIGSAWSGLGTAGWFLEAKSDGSFRLFTFNGLALTIDFTTATGLWTAGVTYRIRFDSDGITVRLYLDGAMIGSDTGLYTALVDGHGGAAKLGTMTQFALVAGGRWDELRVTNGVCRTGSDAGYTLETLPWPRTLLTGYQTGIASGVGAASGAAAVESAGTAAGVGAASGAAAVAVLTYQTTVSDTTDGTTFTFTNQPIGTAAADRRVIVGTVQGLTPGATGSSVTVGGTGLTLLKRHVAGNGVAEIWMATIASGTTATVVVTWSSAVGRSSATIWSAVALNSDTPVDTDGNTIGVNANSADVTLTTTAGGFAVGIGMHSNFASGDLTWRNMTERYDQVLESQINTSRLTAADATTAGASLTVGLDLNGGTNSDTSSPYAVVALA